MAGSWVRVHAFWVTAALLSCAQVGNSSSPTAEPAVAPAAQPVPGNTALLTLELPQFDALLESAIDAKKLPGAVIAIGRARGLAYLHAFGARAIEPRAEPMTDDTIFDLASLTKPVVTATLIMQLVEARQLDLDVPLATYVPESHTRVTARQLLLHASGLAHVDRLQNYAQDPSAALVRILSSPLSAAPGQSFAYSDLGFIALGQLIERITGTSLAQRAARTLFEPLGMVDSGFLPERARWGRIAPTERITGPRAALVSDDLRALGVIRGQVHDPRAFRLGGVAGNAGAFSSARDLARYARMLLNGGELDGVRVLGRTSVQQMLAPHSIGTTVRALGWDMHSRYSGLRGTELSERAFGHGGFTGTSLWIDPAQDAFFIFLSNRVHPDGRGHVIPLVGQITDIAARALRGALAGAGAGAGATQTGTRTDPCEAAKSAQVLTGIDVLRSGELSALAGRNIGLVINHASRARDGTPTLDVFRAQTSLHVRALFVPEHGLSGQAEGAIHDGSVQGLPVYSLFGKNRRPSAEVLRGLDTIVFDLADVGTRFFTYVSTLQQIMEATQGTDIEVVVLDRPNPIGADHVAGPVLDTALQSFVNYFPLPVQHGMTTGELAALIVGERKLTTKLRVIPLQNYSRGLRFDQTGLTWFAPSPNLPTARAAQLYPALGMLESTNLSVGRGTDYPFAFVGAPWLDARRLVRALERAELSGVRFEATDVTPRTDRYAGQLCHGVRIELDSRAQDRLHPLCAVCVGMTIARALIAQHPQQWETKQLARLVGDPAIVAALQKGATVPELADLWQPALTRFAKIRERYLRYPTCETADAH